MKLRLALHINFDLEYDPETKEFTSIEEVDCSSNIGPIMDDNFFFYDEYNHILGLLNFVSEEYLQEDDNMLNADSLRLKKEMFDFVNQEEKGKNDGE
jgi:hypothetical protein